ncbi:hybrid sensor histidine kinase/response regulator [Rhodoblastus sphagnicola]|uniref:histidine kinase n=1 Tax=Rhodoblastus sphagnicola TaxID=333368 RepID=A0A2S6N585_9HYPH|nr:hybrid sensor histidine kinase/response regulator [Rhodoblastus sphagnicola]MBB4197143.1 signal transduction histidine kinase [Rhodoblastus sphagnicola]PPQ29762.1 hybrid sensor histidine kinase/response regulator [Rhodoblastus sphagnicola]
MNGDGAENVDELKKRIAKLEKINSALMSRVERSVDSQFNAFSLFETAISLDHQVRRRTQELSQAMRSLEKAKRQAEAASSLKTTFVTSVGHDLLQPLNAARLALSALHELPGAPEAGVLVEQVDRSLVALEDLIRTLLDLSKLDAGVMKPDLRDVPLNDVLEPLARDFAYFAQKRGLKLKIFPSKLHVRSDPSMLRRILQNLLANALRYTAHGGVLVGARRRGDRVMVQVSDTGPGIPETKREAIFQEFKRAHSDIPGETGFGLGLAIVRRFAQALDHPVRLASNVGRGSTFYVRLPRAAAATKDLPAPPPLPRLFHSPVAGAKILLIENEPSVSEAMVTLLERWGCDVAVSGSGDEALERLRALPAAPHIVIADLHLNNDERGTQAIARIRATLGADIPALIVTADHSAKSEEEVRAAGLELLRKPVRPAEMRSLLSFLLT